MAKILLIEDDPELGLRLRENLELEGHCVTLAADGRAGLTLAQKNSSDLLLLDLMLPLLDGMQILRQIRRSGITTPVIILTAKGTEHDRLDGFDEGCDDYLIKPFSLKELFSRIRALLRRSGYQTQKVAIYSTGIRIDPESRTVTWNETPIALAPKEFDLLYLLMSHPHRALARSFLLDEVWGENSDVTNRTVDNHIAAIRKKLEENPEEPERIVTVYKVGYRWE